MSRSMKLLGLAAMAVLVVARPTPLSANTGNQQQPGCLFKAPAPVAGGTMNVSVRLQGPTVNVNTRPGNTFTAAGGETPVAMASAVASKLCLAASAVGVCTPTAPLVGCAFSSVAAATQTTSCAINGGGFTITQPAAAPCGGTACPRFFLTPIAPSTFNNGNSALQMDDTSCGGYQADILPLLRLRLVPGSGTATINVLGTPSGTFTIDTSQTDAAIQTDMCTKFGNVGLVTIPRTGSSFWNDPTITAGNSVEVEIPSGVTDVSVDPPAGSGHTFASQMQGVSSNTIPTLSEWGMVVLIALLVLTSVWMLRRRQKLQST